MANISLQPRDFDEVLEECGENVSLQPRDFDGVLEECGENVSLQPRDFDEVLEECGKNVTEKELKIIKYTLTGSGGIERSILQHILTAAALFLLLREKEFISNNDVLYLQAMFELAGNKENLDLIQEYCRTHEDVKHFKKTANGFVHVICGQVREERECERTVTKVAELLCIGEEYVIVEGFGGQMFYGNGNGVVKRFRSRIEYSQLNPNVGRMAQLESENADLKTKVEDLRIIHEQQQDEIQMLKDGSQTWLMRKNTIMDEYSRDRIIRVYPQFKLDSYIN